MLHVYHYTCITILKLQEHVYIKLFITEIKNKVTGCTGHVRLCRVAPILLFKNGC